MCWRLDSNILSSEKYSFLFKGNQWDRWLKFLFTGADFMTTNQFFVNCENLLIAWTAHKLFSVLYFFFFRIQYLQSSTTIEFCNSQQWISDSDFGCFVHSIQCSGTGSLWAVWQRGLRPVVQESASWRATS